LTIFQGTPFVRDCFQRQRLAYVPRSLRDTCVWAGVDNAWEQDKLEGFAKMLLNRADSHTSGACFVGRRQSYVIPFFDY
jgi:hypothetical protein